MPETKRQAFCDVHFEGGDVIAAHFSGIFTRARRRYPPKKLDREALNQLITRYWDFVDRKIREGVLDGDDAVSRQKLLDELKARGAEIAGMLFSKETQRGIWKAAAESDVFVISTNLPEVPWEALFSREFGERGLFLSDKCVIQRQLDSEEELAAPMGRGNASNHLVCLDPILEREEKECAHRLVEHLESLGISLHRTSTKDALETVARDAAVIHWICEHSKEGLRLETDVFYSRRDVDAHRFPTSCVLFMLSCGAGRHDPDCTALSAGIAAASGCTVVAPSSVVAAQAAVRFIMDMQALLRRDGATNLSDVWSRMKNLPVGGRQADDVGPRDCYMLWFGIYGDCDTAIGSVA